MLGVREYELAGGKGPLAVTTLGVGVAVDTTSSTIPIPTTSAMSTESEFRFAADMILSLFFVQSPFLLEIFRNGFFSLSRRLAIRRTYNFPYGLMRLRSCADIRDEHRAHRGLELVACARNTPLAVHRVRLELDPHTPQVRVHLGVVFLRVSPYWAKPLLFFYFMSPKTNALWRLLSYTSLAAIT